jgi:polysaccharide deacetylase family protein (PEP-CTERM system associated)
VPRTAFPRQPLRTASPAARPSEPRAVVRNALTIDVEDYFHVSGFETCVDRSTWDSFQMRAGVGVHRILALLDRAGVRGTFFVLGWLAHKRPELVRSIARAGHEIGCHTYWHRLIYQQTRADFRADLRQARNALEDITGTPVVAFRAPSFSITRESLWALDVLIEEGFTIDSSIYPVVHDRYGMREAPLEPHRIERPAGSIQEFPPAVLRRWGSSLPVGGGGYFRLYPYWFTRFALSSILRSGRPFTVYLHPWELDPDQPRLRPGRMRAFRHYVNLARTESRLQRLLHDFSFGTMSEALALYGEGKTYRY